jgi:hypothetical protein
MLNETRLHLRHLFLLIHTNPNKINRHRRQSLLLQRQSLPEADLIVMGVVIEVVNVVAEGGVEEAFVIETNPKERPLYQCWIDQ